MVQRLAVGGEAELGQDGFVDLCRAPSGDPRTGVQEHLHKADHPGVVDFDAGIVDASGANRQGQPLQQREIDMDVQALGLEGGEAVGDGREAVRRHRPISQERSKILWMGKWRLKMKLRQYSIWLMA